MRCLIQLDKNCIYSDTDSLKVFGDYDKAIINNYNKSVEERIKRVSKELDIPIEKFAPKDSEGISHMLGLFEWDASYENFITQRCKKICLYKMDKVKEGQRMGKCIGDKR